MAHTMVPTACGVTRGSRGQGVAVGTHPSGGLAAKVVALNAGDENGQL